MRLKNNGRERKGFEKMKGAVDSKFMSSKLGGMDEPVRKRVFCWAVPGEIR
jgi:hypothetical protein